MSDSIDLLLTPAQQPLPLALSAGGSLPLDLNLAIPVAGGSALTFTWSQASALAIWTIPHNLNRYPSVTVVDSTGAVVETGVRYVDENIVQVTADQPFSGKAYIN